MVVFHGEKEVSMVVGHGERDVVKVITTPIFESAGDCQKYIDANDYQCYGSAVVRKVVNKSTSTT